MGKKPVKNVFGLETKNTPHVPTEPPKSQIMELRKLLLNQEADSVVRKLLQIALDDEHPGQMAAIKMAIDRVLPMSEFEKIAGGGRPSVTINISGLSDPKITEGEVIDNE